MAKAKRAVGPSQQTRGSGVVVSQTPKDKLVWFKWQPAYAIIPIAAAVASSANTLANRFASDDTYQVLNNTFIRDLRNLPLAFTTTVWSFVSEDIAMTTQPYFRPMFSVLFTISYAIFGTSAWGWHLVNVLIHGANTWLVMATLAKLTGRIQLAAMAALLFAVHPAHSESVAWISGVTDPLMTLFLLPAFYFYLRYQETGRKAMMGIALGFYFLALLSKETAIAFPALVAYHELTMGRHSFKRAGLFVAMCAAPTFLFFVMRYFALGGSFFGSGGPRYPLLPALATTPLALIKYLRLMSVPFGLSYQHFTQFIETAASLAFILPSLAILAIATGVLILRSPLLAFAAVLFLLGLAPALAGIRQFDQEYIVQERYLYFGSIGFCLALALGLEKVAGTKFLGKRSGQVAAAALILITVAWGAVYVRMNGVWTDTTSVFRNCVATDPDLPMARVALASELFNQGRQKEAESLALEALKLDAQSLNAYSSLSFFSHKSGKTDEAIGYLERAIEVVREGPFNRPTLATTYLNLGLLYSQQNRMEEAEEALNRSIELWPRPTGWYYFGFVYFNEGKYENAREMFEQARNRVPKGYAAIHLSLGRVYDRLGQPERAKEAYNRYLELAPANSRERDEVVRRLSQL